MNYNTVENRRFDRSFEYQFKKSFVREALAQQVYSDPRSKKSPDVDVLGDMDDDQQEIIQRLVQEELEEEKADTDHMVCINLMYTP